jgi:hypothetical protein
VPDDNRSEAVVKLVRGNEPIATIFDLMGNTENDVTAALGYTVSRCPEFASRVLVDPVDYRGDVKALVVRLQTHTGKGGITDVELVIGQEVAIVVEAKRGPHVPSRDQLRKYVSVLRRTGAEQQLLVALTNASDALAADALDTQVDGVRVVHRSWRRLQEIADESRRDESHQGKRLLDEFVEYLDGVTHMETRYSNMVYVVSLGGGNPDRWKLSWIDIVAERRRYFYPVGKRWPDPSNYIAFRYWGKLQSIHHVDGFDLFTNPHDIFPEAPSETWDTHYCFKLGPPIVPPREVKAGSRVVRSNRVWCMLDTLLTCPTVSDALTETERRAGP